MNSFPLLCERFLGRVNVSKCLLLQNNYALKNQFVMKKLLMMLVLLLNACFIYAQQDKIVVNGTVTDKMGIPIPGVTVLEKGTTNGTITDPDGVYRLKLTSEKATMVYSFIGSPHRRLPSPGRIV